MQKIVYLLRWSDFKGINFLMFSLDEMCVTIVSFKLVKYSSAASSELFFPVHPKP